MRSPLRCHPCAGPPAVAAINEDMPSRTRNPLRPTAATHKLSAAASTSDPQLSSVPATLEVEVRSTSSLARAASTGDGRRKAEFPTRSPTCQKLVLSDYLISEFPAHAEECQWEGQAPSTSTDGDGARKFKFYQPRRFFPILRTDRTPGGATTTVSISRPFNAITKLVVTVGRPSVKSMVNVPVQLGLTT